MTGALPAHTNHIFVHRRAPRHPVRTAWLYALVLLHEFRYTLLSIAAGVVLGAVVYAVTPDEKGDRPSAARAVYHSWMAMLAQPRDQTPPTVPIGILCAVYPVLGFVLVGEGV